MYLLTAVADLVHLSRTREEDWGEFEKYKTVCERLWNNMVNKKMYLTGGMAQSISGKASALISSFRRVQMKAVVTPRRVQVSAS